MKISYKPLNPIRLYWGENYIPKPPAVMRALGRAFLEANNTLHLYPGELQAKTKKALGTAYKIHPSQIMVGAGIEGILKEILPHLLVSSDTLLTLTPTFGVYEHVARGIGTSVTHIPVTLTKQLTAEDVLSAVTKKTTLIIIASPNTMTGMYHLKIEEYKKYYLRFPA